MHNNATAVWILAAISSLSLLLDPASATTLYVATTGNNANDGQSWATAKQTVQAGLNAATANDQVWVAAGTYVENITLKNAVALFGGFAGNENPATFNLDDRDFTANETILDGNQAGSVVIAPAGSTATTRSDGFTIRNGKTSSGGGIRCIDASPTIADNIITTNRVESIGASGKGGGIYCANSAAIIINTRIQGNYGSSGSAIYCISSSPIITNSVIVGNKPGAIYCTDSSVTIADTTITANTRYIGDYAVTCYSPGNNGPSTLTFANTIIWNELNAFRNLDGSTITITHSNVQGGWPGVGNLEMDPLFNRNPHPGSDGQWATPDDDYGDLQLQPGSLCVDAGDNAAVPVDTADLDADGDTTEPLPFDLAGMPRFLDDPATPDTGTGTPPIVDMGAFEFIPPVAADFDHDGDVDADDLTTFTACSTGPAIPYDSQALPPACTLAPDAEGRIPADFDTDNDVDHTDFAIFQRCYSGVNIPADLNCAN